MVNDSGCNTYGLPLSAGAYIQQPSIWRGRLCLLHGYKVYLLTFSGLRARRTSSWPAAAIFCALLGSLFSSSKDCIISEPPLSQESASGVMIFAPLYTCIVHCHTIIQSYGSHGLRQSNANSNHHRNLRAFILLLLVDILDKLSLSPITGSLVLFIRSTYSHIDCSIIQGLQTRSHQTKLHDLNKSYLEEVIPELIIAIPGEDDWWLAEQQIFQPWGIPLAR